jgi:uncharacterized protein YbjQ (UPF0145 family)
MTPCDSLPGFEIFEPIGLVEVVVEKSFTAVTFHGIGAIQGGGLNEMIEDARFALANLAAERGANSVVGLRFEVAARELEKSVLAYGFAAVSKPLGP